jgi:hypothetical protein
MRPFLILAAIAALSLGAGCSRSDQVRANGDVKDAGRTVDADAAKVAHSPEVKNVEADFKKAGHTASKDLRKLAAEAKAAAHKLASDTHSAAHDVTRDHRSGDHS